MSNTLYAIRDKTTKDFKYFDTHFGWFENYSIGGYSIFPKLKSDDTDDYIWDLDKMIEDTNLEIVKITYTIEQYDTRSEE